MSDHQGQHFERLGDNTDGCQWPGCHHCQDRGPGTTVIDQPFAVWVGLVRYLHSQSPAVNAHTLATLCYLEA